MKGRKPKEAERSLLQQQQTHQAPASRGQLDQLHQCKQAETFFH